MNQDMLLSTHPYSAVETDFRLATGDWPCSWISLADIGNQPHVAAYRLKFNVEKKETVRVHVSADERYVLFLDGQSIGRGPERGAPHHWFFETHDLILTPGDHVLVARVWYMGSELRPTAQMSVYPGFILSPEGDEWIKKAGTGKAPWKGKRLAGYEFIRPVNAWGSGACTCIDAKDFAWGHETGDGEDWNDIAVHNPGFHPDLKKVDVEPGHILQPATLPPMMYAPRQIGSARFVEEPDHTDLTELARRPVVKENDIVSEKAGWDALLKKDTPLTLPANTRRRVLIDLENYYCAYPVLTTSGGAGSTIHLQWAESLYEELKVTWDAPPTFIYGRPKGNRDEFFNKYFIGERDTFLPDGKSGRTFEPLWWQAGRYVQWVIETAGEPLTLDRFELRETRYPLQIESSFESSDKEFQAALPIMQRALLTGAHECYFDCPYYEQLMYTGDTRLETLVTYSLTHDSRLPEKALRMFDISRLHNGLTQGRYPSDRWTDIPTFALYWTNMVHDYACWRNNRSLVRDYLPGIRSVLDSWYRHKDPNGGIRSPGHWNFVDWVHDGGWMKGGVPPDGKNGVCGTLNWHLIYSLVRAAELEEYTGEPEMAKLHRRRATELAAVAIKLFWNKKKGLFADDLSQKYFSEHTQCFALLSGLVSKTHQKQIEKALETESGIAKATIFFSHYYFELCNLLGRMDWFSERLNIWRELPGLGMKTTYEMPGDSRSDNHGWGSHPLYHSFATLLGIRPASMGYRSVHIKPQLGWLTKASGKAIHPDGFIKASFRKDGDKITGKISLPKGIGGVLEVNGKNIRLAPGVKNFVF